MATVKPFKYENGKIVSYRAWVFAGKDNNGKQRRFSKVFGVNSELTPKKAENDVKNRIAEWEKDTIALYGQKSISGEYKNKMSLSAFIDKFFIPSFVNTKEAKPTTIAYYGYMCADIKKYFGKAGLTDIRDMDIVNYVKYLQTEAKTQNGKPYSDSTIKHHYTALRTVFRYAYQHKFIKDNPFDFITEKEKPTEQRHTIDYLDKDELRQFVSRLEKERNTRRKALVYTLLLTGLRRGELVGLQWGDIDLVGRKLQVNRNVTVDKNSPTGYAIGTPKTELSSRTIVITAKLAEGLDELKAEYTNKYGKVFSKAYVFCRAENPYTPIYPTTPTLEMARFEKRYGITHKASPHDLRHTVGTQLKAAGVDIKTISTILGHADTATTSAFYAETTPEEKTEALNKLDDLLA